MADPSSGTISGDDGGMPDITEMMLHKLNESVDPPEWEFTIQSASPDESGAYTFLDLEAGTYRVYAYDTGVFTLYEDEYYDGVSDFDSATDIIVGQDEQVTGIDIELNAADSGSSNSISGTVSTVDDTMPESVNVVLHRLVTDFGEPYWEFYNSRSADGTTGEYLFDDIDTGTYRVEVQVYDTSIRHSNEYYDGASDLESATDIIVNDGDSITGIDFELDLLGSIAGTVTNEGNAPIAELPVVVYTDNGGGYWYEYDTFTTQSDGTYLVTGLQNGTYRIRFGDIIDEYGNYYGYTEPEYAHEFYDNAQDVESATDITVASNAPVTEIDAQLVQLASISGTVTDPDGNPVVEMSVSLHRLTEYGDWTSFRSSTTDQTGSYTIVGLTASTIVWRFRTQAVHRHMRTNSSTMPPLSIAQPTSPSKRRSKSPILTFS